MLRRREHRTPDHSVLPRHRPAQPSVQPPAGDERKKALYAAGVERQDYRGKTFKGEARLSKAGRLGPAGRHRGGLDQLRKAYRERDAFSHLSGGRRRGARRLALSLKFAEQDLEIPSQKLVSECRIRARLREIGLGDRCKRVHPEQSVNYPYRLGARRTKNTGTRLLLCYRSHPLTGRV
jgi:hypothetical protein